MNLADEQPAILARLRKTLDTWSSEVASEAPEVDLSADELEQLRSLGYID